MTAIQRMGVGGLLAALAVAGFGEQALAQRERQRPEVRGVIKSVDTGGSSITLSMPGPSRENLLEKTFAVAPTAEIAAGAAGAGRGAVFSEAKIGDLSPGLVATLSLSMDEKTVEGLLVEEPQVRGVVKTVDLASKRITVQLGAATREQTPEKKAFAVADGAEIVVDDGRGRRFSIREGRLADVAPGSQVTVWLSLDRQKANSILAEGASLIGTVKSFDPASRSLVLTTRPARGDDAGEERTLSVAEDASILLDDGKGKRLSLKVGKQEDVKAGSTASVRLSVDQGKAMQLRVEGPTLTGLLKSADAAKQTITIAIPRGRGEAPDEKTIAVAKDARITSEGVEATLGSLKPAENGPLVQLRMSLDQTTAHSIVARQFPQR